MHAACRSKHEDARGDRQEQSGGVKNMVRHKKTKLIFWLAQKNRLTCGSATESQQQIATMKPRNNRMTGTSDALWHCIKSAGRSWIPHQSNTLRCAYTIAI